MKKRRPRLLLTTASYRIVRVPWCSMPYIEEVDGWDAMNVRRWIEFGVGSGTDAEDKFSNFVSEVATALERRAKRRARKGCGK